MEAVNDFSRGMQSDISKLIQAKNTYLEAINFRPFSELGGSGGSLVTIKGNRCGVKFPTMNDIFKLRINLKRPNTLTDTINITITGPWGTDTLSNVLINSSTEIVTIYTQILALANYGTKYKVAYKDDYLIFYQVPTTSGCEDDAPGFTVNITQNSAPGVQNTLSYIKKDGTYSGVKIAFIPASAYPLIPIGYTTILEDIYLLVAEDNPAYTDIYPTGTGVPSNDGYAYPGYIWKLQYNESLNATTLTLMYAAYLDFTKYAPVAPSAAIGRYESDQIQRIYWSDFYNKVRTLNVGDPQLMALNPVLAGLNPSIEFDIPIMTNIISGSLPVGTYELCYRLKQSLGAITNYSTVSNMVHLASPDINDFVAYEGTTPGNNSNKGIRFKLSNLDGAYDRVEAVVLFRDSKTDVCKVYSVTEVNIPASNEINVDVTTLNNLDEILLTDFLAIQSSFTHAKTVDTKDNRLFWGNVKTKTSALGNYDARAFRAKTSGGTDIRLTNNGVNALFNPTTAAALPETSDCINEYYDTSGNYSANACYYKPGTAKLGGAGSRISYEFGTYSTCLDWRLGGNSSSSSGQYNADGSYNIYNDVPFRAVPGRTNNIYLLHGTTTTNGADSTNQVYVQDSLDCLKSPYRSTILAGYQHEEIYRFGIQFYDLEGVPYFTKWIGDIKFPTYGDHNDNPDAIATAAGISDFRLSFNYNSIADGTQTWGQTMYIKFTVDVTGLEDTISGYRIVRLERKSESDKTILGVGLVTPTYAKSGTSDFHLPANWNALPAVFATNPLVGGVGVPGDGWNAYPGQDEWETLSLNGGSGGDASASRCKTFDCFDFTQYGYSYKSGDKLYIRSMQISKNYVDALAGGSGFAGRKFGYRWFDYNRGNGTDWLSLAVVRNHKPLTGLALPGVNQYNAAKGIPATFNFQSGYDSDQMPYYLHMYVDNTVANFATVSTVAKYTKTITEGGWVGAGAGQDLTLSFGTYKNRGRAWGTPTTGGSYTDAVNPCFGHATAVLGFGTGWNEFTDFGTDCQTNAGKVLALYYRPNVKQYGGNTYSARAGNEYIACGSYVPVKRNRTKLNQNITTLTIDTLGGDVYLNYWDIQKAFKDLDDGSGVGPIFNYYGRSTPPISATNPGGFGYVPIDTAEATVSVTYMFPCTNICNQEMRFGNHINTNLNSNVYRVNDGELYASYHSNQSDVVKYFSEPLDFVETDKWINRIYYSEVKYNNETADSWQVYKTNNFYDVEGNYGQIFSLQAFKGNLYYIQERGFGILYVNPMTAVTSDNNVPVVLGLGDTIQRHNYIALDIGTMHQWSVFRSPNAISFIDSRHKAQYLFDGSSLQCVSDLKGQRNFFIKRFHPELILRDNPIINKGVHTTYDYYHKEFITTFSNYNADSINGNEYYTIAYSEAINAYSSFYSFVPTVYFNNNRYMLTFFSSDAGEAIYVHNVGLYNTFYGTYYPSYIKTLVNDNPKYTKVFDNLSFATESVDDQVEWIDEIITPQSNSQAYSDNINMLTDTFKYLRCYNEYQNTDWTTLTVDTNLKKREQTWNTFVPRNKVDYDTLTPSTSTIFNPAVLTKTDFGERMRDKYLVVDLRYDHPANYRFIVHNLITSYRPSAR